MGEFPISGVTFCLLTPYFIFLTFSRFYEVTHFSDLHDDFLHVVWPTPALYIPYIDELQIFRTYCVWKEATLS